MRCLVNFAACSVAAYMYAHKEYGPVEVMILHTNPFGTLLWVTRE